MDVPFLQQELVKLESSNSKIMRLLRSHLVIAGVQN